MSPKQDRFKADAEPTSPLLFGKDPRSDKLCSANSSDSDSESEIEPPQWGTRVGLRGGRYREYTLAEKFEARIIRRGPTECWPIQGSQVHSGHVQLSIGSPWRPPYIRIRAHVYAWQVAHGRTVPAGKVIMHTCDNPPCCNPAHLQLGTQRENVYDSIRKGRYNTFGIQKLNAEQVREIRARAKAGELQKSIAKAFGIARNTVSGIVNRKSWDHLTDNAALDAVFERVPSVQLPVVGELHVGESVGAPVPSQRNSLAVSR